MSDKIKIVFDVDGVLLNTIAIISDIYFNEHFAEIESGMIPFGLPHFVKKFNLEDEFPLLTIQDLDRYFVSDQFFLNRQYICDPNGFSMKSLFDELCDDNRFVVGVCTKGSEINLSKKRDLFRDEFKGFDMANFTGMLGTHFGKEIVEADIFIDDVVENLVSAKNAKNLVLFAHRGALDCSWNKDYKKYSYIHVATSVAELSDLIQRLSKK